jgi:glycosyltransferase involved in cell wall biosynthesis
VRGAAESAAVTEPTGQRDGGRAASSAVTRTDEGEREAALRVLYVIGYPQRMAGAARSLLELVRNLPASVEPHVLVMGEGEVADAFRDAGLHCTVLSPPGALGGFGRTLMRTSPVQRMGILFRELLPLSRRVHRLIRGNRIDVVHANEARAALLVYLATRLARRPLLVHLRGEMSLGRLGRWVVEELPDRIVAVSDGARLTLSPRGQRKAATVYNGTRVPEAQGPSPAWPVALREEGKLVVCCFASVVPFKGLHHLVRAVARLNARGWRDRVSFFAVGDFPDGYREYQAWLGDLVRELGVDNLTFTGWQGDPFRFYRVADVTVLPSVSSETLALPGQMLQVRGHEGFPRTHLEAMALGIPVVGTRIAGVPEQIVEGETGLLVPPGDPDALADALERLLESAPLRRRMGDAGRARALERFSTAACVEGMIREYRHL